jgi:putative Mn2+ efflux pump MntP
VPKKEQLQDNVLMDEKAFFLSITGMAYHIHSLPVSMQLETMPEYNLEFRRVYILMMTIAPAWVSAY